MAFQFSFVVVVDYEKQNYENNLLMVVVLVSEDLEYVLELLANLTTTTNPYFTNQTQKREIYLLLPLIFVQHLHNMYQ
jgi:hypothetical protein